MTARSWAGYSICLGLLACIVLLFARLVSGAWA